MKKYTDLEAFEEVNSLHIIDDNGNITHGELVSMEEVRGFADCEGCELESYVLANRAVYHYLFNIGN